MTSDRRAFLRTAAAASMATLGSVAIPSAAQGRSSKRGSEPEEEISAAEDLMREHGVLDRILLIFEAGLRRLHGNEEIAPDVFQRSAMLVRNFVEDYHERLEEKFIFPEFESRKKLTDLVKVLRKQHQAGREVTEVILRQAAPARFRKAEGRDDLVRAARAFIRMYRPHEAREDTVLFPALGKLVPARKLRELGEQFEKEEDKLFGEEGFEKVVAQVAGIEKQLGIYDLDQFTPKLR